MLDGWTDVFQVPGKRTTGTKAQKYALAGPSWKGELPEGVKEYKSPTNMVWILGRTYCTGTPEDYKAVHAFQDKLSVVPLSAYGKAYTPPPGEVDPAIDMKTPPREQVHGWTGDILQAAGLADEGQPADEGRRPDGREDGEDRHRAGQDFDISKLDPAVAKALRGPKAGQKDHGLLQQGGRGYNGWRIS